MGGELERSSIKINIKEGEFVGILWRFKNPLEIKSLAF